MHKYDGVLQCPLLGRFEGCFADRKKKKKEKRGRFLLRNRYAVREECRGHTVVYLNIFAIFL